MIEKNQSNNDPQNDDERFVYLVPEHALQHYKNNNNTFGLVDILTAFWQRRILVAGILISCAIIAGLYALTAEEWYRAEVVLSPADDRAASAASSQLGGLAALAGMNIGASGTVAESLAVLKSRDFAREFIQENNLIPVFFEDKWDAERKDWISSNEADRPDLRDAVKYFHENILFADHDRESQLVYLQINFTDPNMAASWANELAAKLNDRMRQQALLEAEVNASYLRKELLATNVITMQQSIGRLLEVELQKVMLARGNEEFAFRVIDTAHPPKYYLKPNRVLILILGIMFGGLVSAISILLLPRHPTVVTGRSSDDDGKNRSDVQSL